ncbi:uncharacterized protein LOC113336070 [Papaver somniferum]|uniref:uncharacterized protein LOC113336070 n=1 Tax=Papaver somniferum TaxID=3469 RepID=UPI000E704930|nr:uncharacterized protein LOC113336070 [Papaver somniferum]
MVLKILIRETTVMEKAYSNQNAWETFRYTCQRLYTLTSPSPPSSMHLDQVLPFPITYYYFINPGFFALHHNHLLIYLYPRGHFLHSNVNFSSIHPLIKTPNSPLLFHTTASLLYLWKKKKNNSNHEGNLCGKNQNAILHYLLFLAHNRNNKRCHCRAHKFKHQCVLINFSCVLKSSCRSTLYPELCYSSIASISGGVAESLRSKKDVIRLSINITCEVVWQNYFTISKLIKYRKNVSHREKEALHDCLEMVDETLDQLHEARDDLKVYLIEYIFPYLQLTGYSH